MALTCVQTRLSPQAVLTQMPINDFRIQLATAYPDATPVSSGKGATFRVEIATDHGPKEAFIKLLSVEDIAREAICAVLARKLYLPMLQPYYVSVDRVTLGGHLPRNSINVAFGLEADSLPNFRIASYGMEEDLSRWHEASRLAAFDEWIFNRDRIPNNLLFAGDGNYWLIDHDDALPEYASPSANASSQMLQLLSHNKSEIELFGIRNELRTFIAGYRSVDWEEILELVLPHELTGSVSMFNRHIDFLSARTEHLDQIFSESLGIRQRELNLSALPPNSNTKGR